MNATTTKTTEGSPYPNWPEVETTADAAPFVGLAWQRVETYVALRTTERSVEFVVEGPGEWTAPLRPFTTETTEKWTGTAWESVEVGNLPTSPYGGFCLDGCGPYRIIGTAGDDGAAVPDLMAEAVRRLAEYMAATAGANGAGLRSENIPNVWQGEFDARAKARALQDSGAADLLRSFRR